MAQLTVAPRAAGDELAPVPRHRDGGDGRLVPGDDPLDDGSVAGDGPPSNVAIAAARKDQIARLAGASRDAQHGVYPAEALGFVAVPLLFEILFLGLRRGSLRVENRGEFLRRHRSLPLRPRLGGFRSLLRRLRVLVLVVDGWDAEAVLVLLRPTGRVRARDDVAAAGVVHREARLLAADVQPGAVVGDSQAPNRAALLRPLVRVRRHQRGGFGAGVGNGRNLPTLARPVGGAGVERGGVGVERDARHGARVAALGRLARDPSRFNRVPLALLPHVRGWIEPRRSRARTRGTGGPASRVRSRRWGPGARGRPEPVRRGGGLGPGAGHPAGGPRPGVVPRRGSRAGWGGGAGSETVRSPGGAGAEGSRGRSRAGRGPRARRRERAAVPAAPKPALQAVALGGEVLHLDPQLPLRLPPPAGILHGLVQLALFASQHPLLGRLHVGELRLLLLELAGEVVPFPSHHAQLLVHSLELGLEVVHLLAGRRGRERAVGGSTHRGQLHRTHAARRRRLLRLGQVPPQLPHRPSQLLVLVAEPRVFGANLARIALTHARGRGQSRVLPLEPRHRRVEGLHARLILEEEGQRVVHAVVFRGVREDEVPLVVLLRAGRPGGRGAALSLVLQRLEVRVGQEVDEHALALLHHRGDEHLVEDAELLEVAGLGGDVLDVAAGEVAAPAESFLLLLDLDGEHISVEAGDGYDVLDAMEREFRLRCGALRVSAGSNYCGFFFHPQLAMRSIPKG